VEMDRACLMQTGAARDGVLWIIKINGGEVSPLYRVFYCYCWSLSMAHPVP
jgi:hypothetical protein